jgi:hypothetical protein
MWEKTKGGNSLISAPKFLFIVSLLGQGTEGAGLEGLVCFLRQTVYERRTKALREQTGTGFTLGSARADGGRSTPHSAETTVRLENVD